MVEEHDSAFSFYEVMVLTVIFFLFIIYVTGVVLNVLLLLVIFKDAALRKKSSNHFILAISIMDLASFNIIAIFTAVSVVMSAKFHTSRFENLYSQFDIDGFISAVVAFSPLINLQFGFSVDRYFAICHSLAYHKRNASNFRKWIIVISFASPLPFLVMFAVIESKVLHEAIFSSSILLEIVAATAMFVLIKREISRIVRMIIDRFYVFTLYLALYSTE
jgi:hypothetical protein